jgi:hypothetical protein
MYVSFTHKFVYMAPKKTGSTSVRAMLEERYDAQLWRKYEFTHIETDQISPDWRSEGPDWKHVCHLPKEFSDFFIFATIRNPYTLEESRFMHDLRHKYIEDDFPAFIRQLLWTDQPPTLIRKLHQNDDYVPPPGCVPYRLHATIRLEHIDEDFQMLPFYQEGPKLDHLHKSSGKRPTYTPDLARIVRETFKDDFERFGYNPSSWCSPERLLMV